MPSLSKDVPSAALRFAASIDLGKAEASGTHPITIRARTKDPIEHWFWGRIVHDMAGMILDKPTVPLDYCHCPDEVLGFGDRFDTADGDLVVSGQLVPYAEQDRASEVIFKAAKGVPYEGSINFGGDGIQLEEVGPGMVATVNGYQFEGPGVIVRKWPLRGVAVCPYGADSGSEVELSSASKIKVTMFSQEPAEMPSTTKPATAPAETPAEAPATEKPAATEPASDPAAAVDKPADQAGDETPADETKPAGEETIDASEGTNEPEAETPAEQTAPPAAAVNLAAPGAKFLEAFGDQGGVWFAQGKTFEEAQTLFASSSKAELARLTKENEELRTKFAALRGEPNPLNFQAEATPQQRRAAELSQQCVGDNIAKLAAAITIKK